ncbi:MAG: nucleoside deaminase [Litorimonas sp.]
MKRDDQKFMAECVSLALKAAEVESTNGIAALIVKDGKVIGTGVNKVFDDCDPTRHAEIVAIGNACATLGEPSLKGATLYASLQPCEMCLGAIAFSEIETVVFAAQRADVAPKYFMYPGLVADDFVRASKNRLTLLGGVMADTVTHLYVDGQE